MGKILVIAEKPSVARDIAKVLQAKQKGGRLSHRGALCGFLGGRASGDACGAGGI